MREPSVGDVAAAQRLRCPETRVWSVVGPPDRRRRVLELARREAVAEARRVLWVEGEDVGADRDRLLRALGGGDLDAVALWLGSHPTVVVLEGHEHTAGLATFLLDELIPRAGETLRLVVAGAAPFVREDAEGRWGPVTRTLDLRGDGPAEVHAPAHLRLLGGCSLHRSDGEEVAVPDEVATLLALVAVSGGSAPTARVAATLWPGLDDAGLARRRVERLLREAPGGRDLIDRDLGRLRLAPGVTCDLHEAEQRGHRALATDDPRLARAVLAATSAPLLPELAHTGWVREAADRLEGLRAQLAELVGPRDR